MKTTLNALFAASMIATTLFATQAKAAEPMLSTGGYANQLQTVEMMHMLDANGDHMVTNKEADTYFGKLFASLDKNADGKLDSKEWAGVNSSTTLDLTTGGYIRELRNMQMMGILDTNGDHTVSKDEFIKGHQAIFAKIDASSDKMITQDEWVMKHVAG